MPTKVIELTVPQDIVNTRLDVWLAQTLRDASRSYLQKLIKNGKVRCGGHPVTIPRTEVHGGMSVTVELPETPAENTPLPEDNFDYEIVYEDPHMLVINKPPGLVVHPAAGNYTGTVVNALLGRYPEMLDEFEDSGGRPGIVHRLDKDTSGCLVIAKTPQAQFALSGAFADRRVSKCYLALTAGIPAKSSGRIETLIGRHPVNRQKMAVVERNGKEAITLYEVLNRGRYNNRAVALLKVNILTGRTHQIRVHLSHLGNPVLGDAVYGGSRGTGAGRQMLHAWKLRIPHPVSGKLMEFTAELAEDMQRVLAETEPAITLPEQPKVVEV